MKKILFDTDIVIDYLRGRDDARDYVDSIHEDIFISVITIAELYAGVRKGEESKELEMFIETFDVVNLNKNIARAGGLYRNQYKPAYGTGLADALIAASAKEVGAQVVTFNTRHFPMFDDVIQPYERH